MKRPKLGPWLGAIDAILEQDKTRPAKQRHTAKRIFERLKEEHGFTGGYTIVKDYVRSAELHNREMFIPPDTCAGRGAGRTPPWAIGHQHLQRGRPLPSQRRGHDPECCTRFYRGRTLISTVKL